MEAADLIAQHVEATAAPRITDLKTIFSPLVGPQGTAGGWDTLGGPRQAVLEALHFIYGGADLRQRTDLITALKNQDWERAAGALLASPWYRFMAKVADVDAEILRTGVFPS